MAKKANGDGTYRKLPSGNWQVQAMDGYGANCILPLAKDVTMLISIANLTSS